MPPAATERVAVHALRRADGDRFALLAEDRFDRLATRPDRRSASTFRAR